MNCSGMVPPECREMSIQCPGVQSQKRWQAQQSSYRIHLREQLQDHLLRRRPEHHLNGTTT